MKKTLWNYRVKNEVLRIFQEEKSKLPTIISWKVNWIGSVLRMNCLLKHFIEGEIERTGRRRRIRRMRRRKRRRRRRRRRKKRRRKEKEEV